MGIFEKAISKKATDVTVGSRYTAEEYEFLFTLVKNSTFKGEHLEFVYNLIVKLQEDYIAIKKTNE
jgi:hypothetical protein